MDGFSVLNELPHLVSSLFQAVGSHQKPDRHRAQRQSIPHPSSVTQAGDSV